MLFDLGFSYWNGQLETEKVPPFDLEEMRNRNQSERCREVIKILSVEVVQTSNLSELKRYF